jgi:nitrogen fixation/metabolism regulation signal transduction histidine kinase
MPIIFKWLSFILIAALAVSIFFWFRLRKASKFQGRLTLFFFLFVIIPLTPFALFLGQLLMTSTETFMLPGVEKSLTQSLDTFREQLNDRGLQFLKSHPSIETLTPELLERSDVNYVGELSFKDSIAIVTNFINVDIEQNDSPLDIQTLTLDEALQLPLSGKFYRDEQHYIFESWIQLDSSFFFAGFIVPEYVTEAKNQVTRTLSNYTTLVLLGETMVQGNAVWLVVFIIVLFIAIISALLARTVSAGISGPIRNLTEGMHRIGSGDLSYRVKIKAKDEVAYLVDSFNQMAEELKTSRESLQRAERAAAWRDVARQVSHEIKNPLTPIEFSIYRLETTLPTEMQENTDLAESLRIIKEEIASIRRIANTFSKFAKMPHSEPQSENIGAIVFESIELFRNDADAKNIGITFEQADHIPLTAVDAQQIKSVFHNLIKNAIEAGKPSGAISIKVSGLDSGVHTVQITISDNGCGMTEETQKRIFDPYFTTKEEGSGIGLFLAQRIIADHRGDINVASTLDAGTIFTIRL